ncbi:MAG: DUF2721 domain-containing protein [Verrucomicrobia bacterium]|nr:DUF2721 domain-containing protein [Leptolyngbya sp. ES-bin-22]
MELTLTTPALLFPAISLVLLAYTKRFLTLVALVCSLHADYTMPLTSICAILKPCVSCQWMRQLEQAAVADWLVCAPAPN